MTGLLELVNMAPSMIKQRIPIIEHYYQNHENLIALISNVPPTFCSNNVPTSSTVTIIFEKFEATGSAIAAKQMT